MRKMKNPFSMEARNKRLQKRLNKKKARAKNKELKQELIGAELFIRNADSTIYNMKQDFKVNKKIKNINRKTKKS